MQSVKRNYKTHDGKLLAIIEAFHQWRHYLQYLLHEVLVLTDYNNLRRFMDEKKFSVWQIKWTQELFTYNFRINYRLSTCNPVDGLSQKLNFLETDNNAIKVNKRCLYRLQQSFQKELELDIFLTLSIK